MAFPEGAERRWLVFCVSERPDENAALWQWCSTTLFDPHRDSVTFLYCRTETNVILVRRTCHLARCGLGPRSTPGKIIGMALI
jgi:hypothetical protein